MKKIKVIFVSLIFLFGISCSEDNINSNSDNLSGQVVFYTNAQALLKCSASEIEIKIDSVNVGTINKPCLNKGFDICNQTDSTLLITKEEGEYSYLAKSTCSNDAMWKGTFKIVPDSCLKLFLDIENIIHNEMIDKLLGTWVEKNPELYDGIPDTIHFSESFSVQKHFYFNNWSYSYCNDTIAFYKANQCKKFSLAFIDPNEIVINNFIDRRITQVVKNIHFIKNNNYEN